MKILYGGQIKLNRAYFRKGFILTLKNGSLKIGRRCFFNYYCSINCMDKIEIGDNCIFGEAVKIYDHDHKFTQKDKPFSEQGFRKAPVKIGNNCWLGSNVAILKGVTIGDNVVVGAGEIVRKDIPSDSVLVDGVVSAIRYKKD